MIKTRYVIAIILVIFSSTSYSEYKGSSKGGFWHSSTINRIQLGWDKRIYVFIDEPHKCSSNSDLLIYQHGAKGREMILSALLSYESSRRPVSFRIDSCNKTDGDVMYGLFDKMESTPDLTIFYYINKVYIRIYNSIQSFW